MLMGCSEDSNMRGHEFIEAVESISRLEGPERSMAAQKLIEKVNRWGNPLFLDETRVVIAVESSGDSLLLMGDMNAWKAEATFTRVAGTDLHYYLAEFEPEARLQYWLQFEPEAWPSVDTLNPRMVSNGWGKMSELRMPAYQTNPIFEPFKDGGLSTTAELDSYMIPAGKLGYPHQIHVWIPEQIPAGEQLGCVYFQDGLDYIQYGHMTSVLKALVDEGKMAPVIAVFVTPPNYGLPAEPNRATEYGLNPDYIHFLVHELVPFVEERYPVKRDPDSRMITGDSFAGLASLYAALQSPGTFGLAYSQSGYVSFKSDSLIHLYRRSEQLPLKLALDTGTYEWCIGGDWIPPDEQDFTAANRRMHEVLKSKGYELAYAEYPEGHTWGNWREHQFQRLPWFFPAAGNDDQGHKESTP